MSHLQKISDLHFNTLKILHYLLQALMKIFTSLYCYSLILTLHQLVNRQVNFSQFGFDFIFCFHCNISDFFIHPFHCLIAIGIVRGNHRLRFVKIGLQEMELLL
nr:hypothetical protein Itr_chr10CG20530 [Ipomoea trifida]